MKETDRTLNADEGEETMVAPRFDDEETMVARPVVPLEEVGSDAPRVARAKLSTYLRTPPRRTLVAALVLVSALAGGILGGAALYLYQKHRSDNAPATEQQQQADAPASQPTPEPTPEPTTRETAATAQPSADAPAATGPVARADNDASDSARDRDKEEAAAAPVAERRSSPPAEPAPVVTPKHGKRGERDEEPERVERRARRDSEGDDERQARADERENGPREARRVGVITYRPRRVRERRGPYGDGDRLRRIFEGQP
jgi:hypothetical protein